MERARTSRLLARLVEQKLVERLAPEVSPALRTLLAATEKGNDFADGAMTAAQCQFRRLGPSEGPRDDHASSTKLKEQVMKRYVIERDLPGVGSMSGDQLKAAAGTSNAALARLGGKVQWVESFVANDKTFCIYLADSEASVQEHARLSGFPATTVTEVHGVIDPMTAV